MIIRFSLISDDEVENRYRVDLDIAAVGQAKGTFLLPYDGATLAAIRVALAPGFVLEGG